MPANYLTSFGGYQSEYVIASWESGWKCSTVRWGSRRDGHRR